MRFEPWKSRSISIVKKIDNPSIPTVSKLPVERMKRMWLWYNVSLEDTDQSVHLGKKPWRDWLQTRPYSLAS